MTRERFVGLTRLESPAFRRFKWRNNRPPLRGKGIVGYTSPGLLSILITISRHNMAAISEIADFRTRSALFVICSVILGLSTHSSIGESQGRNELHVCQRWRMKANDEGANFTRKEKEHFKFCVQIRYVFPLCR